MHIITVVKDIHSLHGMYFTATLDGYNMFEAYLTDVPFCNDLEGAALDEAVRQCVKYHGLSEYQVEIV